MDSIPTPDAIKTRDALSIRWTREKVSLFWGAGQVAGRVTVLGVPAVRRVWLLSLLPTTTPFTPAAFTWSATDGAYAFQNYAPGPYLLLAVDQTGAFDPQAKLINVS